MKIMLQNRIEKKLLRSLALGSFLMCNMAGTMSEVSAAAGLPEAVAEDLSAGKESVEEDIEELPGWYDAIEEGDMEAFVALLEAGGVSGRVPQSDDEFPGCTPLQVAISYCEYEMANMLLDRGGVDINVQRLGEGSTALHCALVAIEADLRSFEYEALSVSWRLWDDPRIDLLIRDGRGKTAYDRAKELITVENLGHTYWAWKGFLRALRKETRKQLALNPQNSSSSEESTKEEEEDLSANEKSDSQASDEE
jgi:hypothetical protein